jgi:hypothetical protein
MKYGPDSDSLVKDATVCIVPGIGNSAESGYIRTSVKSLQENGFRVAVLNHLGAIPEIQLTSPRVYRYMTYMSFKRHQGVTMPLDEAIYLFILKRKEDYSSKFRGHLTNDALTTKIIPKIKKNRPQNQFQNSLKICPKIIPKLAHNQP